MSPFTDISSEEDDASATIIPAMPVHKHTFFINRAFALLWMGQTISEFGSRITREGLPLLANLVLGVTAFQMGLLAAVDMLPVLLISLVAGVWVDRLRRRPILIITDLGRAVLLGSIPVAAILGWLHIEQLYIVAALVGILTVFFEVAHQSLLPVVVPREHLVEGNSKLSATDGLAEVGGPALAGVLVQAITAPMAILFDAFSFLVSACCIGLMRVREPEPVPPSAHQHFGQDIRAGLHLVWDNPLLRALALCSSIRRFCGGAFATLYGLFLLRVLGVTPALFGVVVGMGGVGSLLGASLAGRLRRRWGMGTVLIGSTILSGFTMLLTSLANGPLIAVVTMLLFSQLVGDCAYEIYAIHTVSLRQSLVPDHVLGRANASMHFLVEGMLPPGALLAGIAAELIGIRSTLLIASCIGFLLPSVWLLCSPVRKLR